MTADGALQGGPGGICAVVPCFNEEKRLQLSAFRSHVVEHPSTRFIFVNDGSTDGTLVMLRKFCEQDPFHFATIDQQPNQGKAAAVRTGMLQALEWPVRYAGYWDADLATPLDEIPRFVRLLDTRPEVSIVFGSRVKLLGRVIERRALRHYLGRVFATAVSNILDLPVYDTQCGAKVFRINELTRKLFEEPFRVNWVFDVEIIARLLRHLVLEGRPRNEHGIYELPLLTWKDVAGSKVRARDFFIAVLELRRIRTHYLAGLRHD